MTGMPPSEEKRSARKEAAVSFRLAGRGPRRAAAPRRGMTLIEIMVVLVILGVLAAFTVPSMRGMNEKNKLRAAARELVALSKAARAEAVFGERTTELVLDLNKHQYWLDLRLPPEEKRLSSERKKRTRSLLEEKRPLSGGVTFFEVSAYDQNIIKDKLVAIDFYPDGSASPTLLSLRNGREQVMTIEFLKASGQAEITAGTVEEKKAAIEEAAAGVPHPPTGGAGGGF